MLLPLRCRRHRPAEVWLRWSTPPGLFACGVSGAPLSGCPGQCAKWQGCVPALALPLLCEQSLCCVVQEEVQASGLSVYSDKDQALLKTWGVTSAQEVGALGGSSVRECFADDVQVKGQGC